MLPDEDIDRSDVDRRDYTIRMWQIYRDYTIREDTLLAQRLGNFLLHQAFLFAAVAALMNRVIEDLSRPAADSKANPLLLFGHGSFAPDAFGILILILIGIAGLAASLASARSTQAGHLALLTLRQSWTEWKQSKESKAMRAWEGHEDSEERQGSILPEDKSEFEPYGLPGIDSAGSNEVRELAKFPSDAKDIPRVFAAVWIVFIFMMVGLVWGLNPKSGPPQGAAQGPTGVTVPGGRSASPTQAAASSPPSCPQDRSVSSKP